MPARARARAGGLCMRRDGRVTRMSCETPSRPCVSVMEAEVGDRLLLQRRHRQRSQSPAPRVALACARRRMASTSPMGMEPHSAKLVNWSLSRTTGRAGICHAPVACGEKALGILRLTDGHRQCPRLPGDCRRALSTLSRRHGVPDVAELKEFGFTHHVCGESDRLRSCGLVEHAQ